MKDAVQRGPYLVQSCFSQMLNKKWDIHFNGTIVRILATLSRCEIQIDEVQIDESKVISEEILKC